MERKGEIAYRFESSVSPGKILYVNLIANYSCINDCLFCARPRGKEEIGKPNIYERGAGASLFLAKSPSVDQIMDSIKAGVRNDDSELAFVGLGEPLIYLPKVIKVIKQAKERYNLRTRIDTNGLAGCMFDNPVGKLEEARLDEIRISLNAINKQEYNKLCRPSFDNAYPSLVNFVKECVNSAIDTRVSFVLGFEHEGIRERTKEEYLEYAQSLGVKPKDIIFRYYMKPIVERSLNKGNRKSNPPQ